MRIAFVVREGLAPTSGGNIYDRHLVDGLLALGEEVEVIALPPPGPGSGAGGAGGEGDTNWVQAAMRCDVVLEDELVHAEVLPGHAALRAARIPIVSLVHNLTSCQPAHAGDARVAAVERAYFESVDGAVTVCADTLAGVRAGGGAHLPAVVAYAGREDPAPALEESWIETRARQPGPLRLLHVGVVAPHKGLHRLLSALATLPPGTATLDVAGWVDKAPSYVGEIRARLAQPDLSGVVRLHGAVPRALLQELYRSAHALALPSDRESYPLSGLEALAFGLPLLITDQGGTGELIGASGEAGEGLYPDDIPAWASWIHRWHTDRQQLASRALAARTRYLAHSPWLETARTAQSLLRELTRTDPLPVRPRPRSGKG